MSEYTPSTADIKWAYEEQCNHYYAECEVPDTEHAKEFDRWLTKHDAEVAKAERKRIADLIDREVSEWLSHDGSCDCELRGEEGKRLIELIRGGNK